MKKFVLTVMATSTLYGCGTFEPKPEDIAIVTPNIKASYTYSADANGKQVSIHDFSHSLADSIGSASIYGPVKTKTEYPSAECAVMSFGVCKDPIRTEYYRGVSGNYESSTSEFVVNYVKSKKTFFNPRANKENIIDSLDSKVFLDLKTSNQNGKTTFSLSSNKPVKSGYQGVFQLPIANPGQISSDLESAFNKINPVIKRSFGVSEEITVNIQPESVVANIKRILGDSNSNMAPRDAKKEGVVTINTDSGKTVKARVEIYPYRNTKSKVNYSYYLPYELLPNGTSTFDSTLVSELNKKLVAVFKD